MPGTVVYQSFRTQDVPAWIATCLETVREWAASRGYTYRFIDDSLFERVPEWFREKAHGEICPQADLARLVVARELLDEGFERTVWVDADMLMFAPEHMGVEINRDFIFTRELWVDDGPDGRPRCTERVNNSVMVFHRQNVHLEFFIDACLRTGRAAQRIHRLSMSTKPYTRLYQVYPYSMLAEVGIFSPAIMRDIELGTTEFLDFYARHLGVPIACANLCSSLEHKPGGNVHLGEGAYTKVVKQCLATRGGIINDRIAATLQPG